MERRRASTDCIAEGSVLAFLSGTLAADDREQVERHIGTCAPCADLVTWAAADQADTTGVSGKVGRPFVGELQPGARVGRYQILGALGRGGMGEVYAAYHPDLDRKIALKVVQGFGGDSGQRRARLLREARAIARLSHPNVVAVHDAGTFGDRVFIAMELIDGQTIDQWLRVEQRTWQTILGVFIAAARGLAAAHAAGVIHRDFKPQNVMIAKDGSVRVMDFGLARLDHDDARESLESAADHAPVALASVTKTGALLGTPAYMSPEQFRRAPVDARSDQFSFCVALHEALLGSRPAAASTTDDSPVDTPQAPARANVPGWLRAVVLRGASANREHRFRSMSELIAALERGRTRLRRRFTGISISLATLLLSGGAWRLAHHTGVACVVPRERVTAAWAAGDAADPRRQSIHRAFTAGGRPTAKTAWERLSKILDEHVTAWSAMYLQSCEATHVRGEQSAEVLDLRMSCLNDNLDQVRALTDTIIAADSITASRAMTAVMDLTPVTRCADIGLLKSAVPLPKDERTLREVQRVRRALREVDALREFGRYRLALSKANALRPAVAASGFGALAGELLQEIGLIQAQLLEREAAKTLEEALFAATAAHDDLTAAKAATILIETSGSHFGRREDAERWWRLANALLDRVGESHSQTRAWALQSYGLVLCHDGEFEAATAVFEKAVTLKEHALGRGHPDVALSLTALAWPLAELDRLDEALVVADRAVAIQDQCCEPNNLLAIMLTNRAEILHQLHRDAEARPVFQRVLQMLHGDADAPGTLIGGPLDGLGAIALADGRPAEAVPLLENALTQYEQYPGGRTVIGQVRYNLAQALWDSRIDRRRSLELAKHAREDFAAMKSPRREREVALWLSTHRRNGGTSPARGPARQ
jgi:serine/threonine protein kinase/Tfp pilus assembly protein PilF